MIAGLGRILLSLFFLIAAGDQFLHWEETLRLLEARLAVGSPDVVPFAASLLGVLLSLELFGALALLLGVFVRLGAFFLMLIFIPSALLFHPYLTQPSLTQPGGLPVSGIQLALMSDFLKNLGVLGGLLLALAYGGRNKKQPHAQA